MHAAATTLTSYIYIRNDITSAMYLSSSAYVGMMKLIEALPSLLKDNVNGYELFMRCIDCFPNVIFYVVN